MNELSNELDAFLRSRVMPITALYGQDRVKQALLMAAVNPRLCGLLIRGGAGMGKSTAARGLAAVLPPIRVNEGCPFGCLADREDFWCESCRVGKKPKAAMRRPPFRIVYPGITKDELIGTVDPGATSRGESSFRPGLLAHVNGGVLCVEDVNLFEDVVVDRLLECADTGVNVVASRGMVVVHPAEFTLVATMNPQAGELPPRVVDRFGLCAEMELIDDPVKRSELVQRRTSFEFDPDGFREEWAENGRAQARDLMKARTLLPEISPEPSVHTQVAAFSLSLGIEGHRADVLTIRGACTLAALAGRTSVEGEDLQTAATLVYQHRAKSSPNAEWSLSTEQLRARIRDSIPPREP